MHAMSQQTYQCPRCGSSFNITARQRITGSGLGWSISSSCPNCGHQEESDGIGLPPADVRADIIARDGEWELVLTDASQSLKALEQLRRELGLSLSDVRQIKANIPGTVIRGTNVEMSYLKMLLAKSGTSAIVRTKGADSNELIPDLADLWTKGK